uniref:Proteasome maturation protein n=1 Tax=Sus scrofa TaxID=9823 RepID=A0A8D1F4F7_PIG
MSSHGVGGSWPRSGPGSGAARERRLGFILSPLLSSLASPSPPAPAWPLPVLGAKPERTVRKGKAWGAELPSTPPPRGDPLGAEFSDSSPTPDPRNCLDSKPTTNARGLGSQLKDSIPVTELSASGPFESQDLLRKGFSCVRNELLPSHPLELSEKNFQLNQDKMNFSTLRNIQGLFAPLKLQMEFKAVQQVQHLPFLPSSNLSLDILRGNDETIGFEDILNDPSQSELMGEPHLMVEYKLGLL